MDSCAGKAPNTIDICQQNVLLMKLPGIKQPSIEVQWRAEESPREAVNAAELSRQSGMN